MKSLFRIDLLVLSAFLFPLISDAQVVKGIKIDGIKRTKPTVILREVGVSAGDSVLVPDSMTQVWQKRLSSLNLFNLVSVYFRDDTLHITVVERIYTWVEPELQWADRNFNVWWQTKDPARLIYGGTVIFKNVKGLNHTLMVRLVNGYNRDLEINYSVPFKRYNSGWAWDAGLYYWTNHELWYRSENDVLQFLKSDDGKIQTNAGADITIKKRINYFSRIEYSAIWGLIRVDSIAYKANPDYLYGGTVQNQYSVAAEFVSDHRDQKDYPLNGHLLRVGSQWSGFNELRGVPLLGKGWLRYTVFKQLTAKNPVVWAGALVVSMQDRRAPYRLSRQLGYQNDYVRGYEPYVGDGQGFVLARTGLRKAILNQKVMKLPISRILNKYAKVPLSLWLNIFADMGRVYQPYNSAENPLSALWYRGAGAGLDVIAWYSAMIRTECTVNHMGKAVFNVTFKNAF